jgi:hypothetical protein
LDQILSELGNLLSSSFIIVQEEVISALATIADAAQDYFDRYYDAFMPHMKTIIQVRMGRVKVCEGAIFLPPSSPLCPCPQFSHPTPKPCPQQSSQEKTYRMLRAKTFEAATLMGVAVGKERFREDALALIRVLLATDEGGISADDPQTTYMLGCWSRICQVLEDEFLPFLPSIMPGLLKTAKQPPGIRQLELDDEDVNPEEWTPLSVDDELIGIKTSSLEEKRNAFEVLVRFAQRLRGHFAPYVQEMLSFTPDLMRFYFDEDVRVLSMEIVAYLLTACIENEQVRGGGGEEEGYASQRVGNGQS